MGLNFLSWRYLLLERQTLSEEEQVQAAEMWKLKPIGASHSWKVSVHSIRIICMADVNSIGLWILLSFTSPLLWVLIMKFTSCFNGGQF